MVHFADPWCWWSWGLEPVLRRLKEVYGDGVEIVYRMGGVFDDVNEWMKEYGVDEDSTVDWVKESIEITKNPLNPDYLRQSGVKSSYASCLAFRAAAMQDPHKSDRYFRRLMEAFQLEARPLSDEVLAQLATEVGLDGQRILKDMTSRGVQKSFEADMEAMATSHANFLSLLMERGEDGVLLGETFTSKPFEEEIDKLAPGLPKRTPTDILEYLEKLHGHLVSTQEVSEVFQILPEDAEARLQTLEEAGFLESRRFPFASYWAPLPIDAERIPTDIVKVSHVLPEALVETKTDLTPIITTAVKNLYTQVATQPKKEYHFPLGLEALKYVGYEERELAKLPPEAVESFAGVGYPFAANVIKSGDVVLDIGSGSGTDILYASLKVGPEGRVYGLDFTPAMIEKARRNIAAMKLGNVVILEGEATDIPLPDASVDVVTSNGVLNLVPNKSAAFREILRVLRPGGRLQLADIVVQEDVGAVCGINPQLWADCIGGAAVEEKYVKTIEEVGFQDLRVLRRLDYFSKSSSHYTRRLTKSFGAESISLVATKP